MNKEEKRERLVEEYERAKELEDWAACSRIVAAMRALALGY